MSTILVVDDERSIQGLVTRVLEKRGHRVIACTSAAEALVVTDVIDLLLVDFILPELNGQQLTEKLRARQPKLPVVLMSGYLPPSASLPSPPSTFLQKPMMPGDVVRAIEALLPKRAS